MRAISKLCWGFCNMANDASLDENFPDWMRWAFGALFGEFWFWAAMTFQGDALAAFRERMHERRLGTSSEELSGTIVFV